MGGLRVARFLSGYRTICGAALAMTASFRFRAEPLASAPQHP